jgi:tetratricopeptide (TPR) repeat protein
MRETTLALAATVLLGMSATALAAPSAYQDYCRLHPHKSYCWDRHHHLTLGHGDQESSGDAVDCDQSKDVDRSIRGCTQLIEKNPRDVVAAFNRGVGYDDMKDYDRAIADYSKAIEINPSAAAYSNRGYTYTHKRDYDRAFADYNTAIEIDPEYADAYFNRGNAYDDKQEFDRAIAEYSRAIDLDPKQADFYGDRGIAYEVMGQHDRAIADYNTALELDPKDAQAFDSRGGVYVGKRDYTLAIADFTKAIELNPTNATAYEHRGYARFYRGDFNDAAVDLSHSLALKDSAYPMLFLFIARSRVGEDAVPELEANAGKLHSNEWPYAAIGLYLGRRQPDATLDAASNSVERCQAQFYIGEWDLLHNNPTEAGAALRTAAETCPKTRIEYDAAVAELKRLNP